MWSARHDKQPTSRIAASPLGLSAPTYHDRPQAELIRGWEVRRLRQICRQPLITVSLIGGVLEGGDKLADSLLLPSLQ
ncbi:hypothetical protein NECAME_17591 [Necator americanus]|uniref:Uncharacterized protein n=1 Tax=Necator americanus TaxID=51031 RepID=W2TPN6_NECAM|nr:hypothetical protein NECAME_17591 [Necator americanus]ETN82957.1 hypothetical protein NECAME_17591 [Necator americanus]